MLNRFWMASFGAAVFLISVSAARADLATSIVNGDFESATFTGAFGNNDPAQHPGWTAHRDWDFGASVWFNDLLGTVPGVPTLDGHYSGALITIPDHPAVGAGGGEIQAFTQSLGTVGASDVGKQFELSADLGARGFSTHQWESTMLVGFTADLVDFTPLGTPGVLDVVTPLSTTPVGMETRTAIFTPEAGHVGMEIHALLYVESITPFTADQQQHIVDNVNIVPEPSGLLLMSIGTVAAACTRLRRKRKEAAASGW